MSQVRQRSSTGPKSLDWIVERASRVPLPARPRGELLSLTEPVPWARALTHLLVERAWEKTSVLEIADRVPLLHDWCSERGIGRYCAFLSARVDGRSWAGKHPGYQFFSGTTRSLGLGCAAKFDWIVETGRDSILFSPADSEKRLSKLRELSSRHGHILSRVHYDTHACWVKWSTAYDRAQLRVMNRWKLDDGTSVVLSQR